MGWTMTTPIYPIREKQAPTLDEVLAEPHTREHHYEPRDVDMFQRLYFHRFLTIHQLHRMYFGGKSLRSAQKRLNALYDRGFVDRFRPPSAKGQGSHPYIYTLDSLGYRLLRHLRPDLVGKWYWREKTPEYSRVVHEVELNDFGLALEEAARERGIAMTWLTTRQTAQRVRVGETKRIFAPDAVMTLELPDPPNGTSPLVLHIEWERSASLPTFREKMDTWRAYRTGVGWRDRSYRAEPKIIVVGRKTDAGKMNLYSIEPLRQAAAREGFPEVYFLYREQLKSGTWTLTTPQGSRISLWDLRSRSIWDQIASSH